MQTTELSTEHAQKIAELVAQLAAEETVRRLSKEEIQPLREDMSNLREDMSSIKTTLFNGGDGGVINQLASLKSTCEGRHKKLDDIINLPAKTVNIWKERAKGAAWVFGIVGAFILGAMAFHAYLK